MNTRPHNEASPGTAAQQDHNPLQLEPTGPHASPASSNPVARRKPWTELTPVQQAERRAAAKGAASIVTNDSATRQPLSDEPATSVTPSRRVPVRQPVREPVRMPAGNNQEQDRPFMDARKFHRVVFPGTDFDEWLDRASAKDPGDFGTSDNGEEPTITLLRARNLTFHAEKYFGKAPLDIIREVEASGVANPGAVVDARFDDLILVNGIYVQTSVNDLVFAEEVSKFNSSKVRVSAPVF